MELRKMVIWNLLGGFNGYKFIFSYDKDGKSLEKQTNKNEFKKKRDDDDDVIFDFITVQFLRLCC